MEFEWFSSLIGTIAFAISGASVGIQKKMDIFGVTMLGFVTAIGGGVIRDMILGIIPPAIFRDPFFALISIITSLTVFTIKRYNIVKINEVTLLIMDSIGLAIFTVIGVRAGIVFEHPFLAVFMGLLTGVGGGVLRDLFAGEKPYIFVKHFYACASIIGATVAVLFWPMGKTIAMTLGAITIFSLRVLAAKYRWSLPKAK